MQLRAHLRRKLRELPVQMEMLRSTPCEARAEVVKEDDSLWAYEQRMREGLQYLISQPDDFLRLMNSIRTPPRELLDDNTARYLEALRGHRRSAGRAVSEEQVQGLEITLRTIPFTHSTGAVARVRLHGIQPASGLWWTPVKSSANPMDVALGLDEYVFLTHGFGLRVFSADHVEVDPHVLGKKAALVSTVDIFKLVLVRTGRSVPCAIDTREWLPVLGDYARQLFAGGDFWRLKSEYVLTFFSDLDDYHRFAQRHFYENHAECAPRGEWPFLGEVKVRGGVSATNLC